MRGAFAAILQSLPAGRARLAAQEAGAPLSRGVAVLNRSPGRVPGGLLLSGEVDEVADPALRDQGFWAVPADLTA